MAIKVNWDSCVNAYKPFQSRYLGQNSKEYLNQSEASRSNEHKYKGVTNVPPFMKLVCNVDNLGLYSFATQAQAQASSADALTSQRLSLPRQKDTGSVPGHY